MAVIEKHPLFLDKIEGDISGIVAAMDRPWFYVGESTARQISIPHLCEDLKLSEFKPPSTPLVMPEYTKIVLELKTFGGRKPGYKGLYWKREILVGQCPRCQKIYWGESNRA